MRTTPILLSLLALVPGTALAADPSAGGRQQVSAGGSNDAAQISYVGSRTRLSIGYDSEFDLVGELFQVLKQAWVGTAWLGNEAGGLQLNYHWLVGGQPEDDPTKLSVQKLFMAFDRNQHNDQKVSAGWGMEKQNYFLGAYAAAGISGKRDVGQTVDTTTDVRRVVDSGIEFEETWQTTTTTDISERPYDYGIGLRVGHFYEEPLIRVRGGVDYEWGDESASQVTLMLGAEKFFRNTPHSVAVRGEVYDKSGHYEKDDSDARVLLLYSYHFGEPYRPSRTPLAPAAPVLVKNEISLSSDTFFDFDKSDLRPATLATLNEMGAKLKAAQVVGPITIVGHACSIGTTEYNQKLSERRARAVRDFLVRQGFDPSELKAEGRGELDPKYPNDTEASRRKNRRVDLEVVTVQEVPDKIATPAVAWKSEPVWIERALHNPVDHKRTVDYYRIEKTSVTTDLKDRSPINRSPVARDDTATVEQDSAGEFIAVLANDSDPDGDALVVERVTQPANGKVVNSVNGVIYTPAPGFVGVDIFTYTASDGRGGSSNPAQVTVTVRESDAGRNQPPQANDDRAVTNPERPVTISVLANDTDPDGDPLRVSGVSQPTNGTVVNRVSNVTYTPNPGFRGTDSFSYTASDGRGGTDVANVTVTVKRY